MAGFVEALARAVREAGGRVLEVGGAVRDRLLGRPARDADLEVYGLSPRALEAVIARFGSVRRVGTRLGVYLLKETEIALPQGPDGNENPYLLPEMASRRRDLTVNALLRDPLTGEILDFHGGRSDLWERRLRHVDPETFGQDPLRLLRVVRLHAELEFRIDPQTGALCRRLDLAAVAWERIGLEMARWLLSARHPGKGLDGLLYVGGERHFPPLHALLGCPVPRSWAREDAWSHTRAVLDTLCLRRTGQRSRDWPLMLAGLLVAVGRPGTTRLRGGEVTAPEQSRSAISWARAFLHRVDRSRDHQATVRVLLREQEAVDRLASAGAGPPAYRRLALRADTDLLLRLAEAQWQAQGNGPAYSAGERARTLWRQEDLLGKAPTPILRGRDLEGLGLDSGPVLGHWLERAFQAQLDAEFATREEGIRWLQEQLSE